MAPSTSTTPVAGPHYTLLGREPSATQIKLYSQYPQFRGYSDRTLDSEKLEAAVVLGLTSGTYQEQVYVLAPVGHTDWVLEELDGIADRIFTACKAHPNPVQSARGWATLFKKLVIAGRLLQLPAEPTHWVSFGFAVDDPIPDWMKPKLLV